MDCVALAKSNMILDYDSFIKREQWWDEIKKMLFTSTFLTPPLCWSSYNRVNMIRVDVKGILPKRPYLSCVSMVGRALLAGYPRCIELGKSCHILNDKVSLQYILLHNMLYYRNCVSYLMKNMHKVYIIRRLFLYTMWIKWYHMTSS